MKSTKALEAGIVETLLLVILVIGSVWGLNRLGMRFTEMLLLATLLTGVVWGLDCLFWRSKRLSLAKKEGQSVKDPLIIDYCRAFFPILLIVLLLRSFLAEPFRIPSGSMRPTLLEGDFILVNKYQYGLRVPFLGEPLVAIGKPKRGDVIVFKHVKRGESMDMIKRVIGLPGDRIQYKNKTIYINGEPAPQEFVSDTTDKDLGQGNGWPVHHRIETLDKIRHDIFLRGDLDQESIPHFNNVKVPPNSYFVMGDNRDYSDDSRYWGFVTSDEILGRAMGIWMSWDSSKCSLKCLMEYGCLKSCLTESIRWGRIGMGLNKNTK